MRPDPVVLRTFLLGLAQGMTASGEAVDSIEQTLIRTAKAYRHEAIEIVVMPTMVLIQTGSGSSGSVSLRSGAFATLRFDQIAALYSLVHKAETGSIEPREGIARLNQIGAMEPRFGAVMRTVGHGILTAGLSLLLVPTWQGAVVAFGLGLLIGIVKLVRSPTLQLVFPIAAAFLAGIAVFLLARYIPLGDPLRVLIAPLAMYLPGAALTTATVELAAGQMISGASRLVTGIVQLGLLAFGILAAAQVVGVSDPTYNEEVHGRFPWAVALLGLVLFAVGNYLHFSAPAATFGWVMLVMLVAYGTQATGALFFGPIISGFIGAVAMTPVAHWIATLRRGAPTQLTFLPGFWVLVPGAAGLIGVTQAGAGNGLNDFADALTSVMAIALGVLIGTALWRFAYRGAAELADLHVELVPVVEPERVTGWRRIVSRFRVPKVSRYRAPVERS